MRRQQPPRHSQRSLLAVPAPLQEKHPREVDASLRAATKRQNNSERISTSQLDDVFRRRTATGTIELGEKRAPLILASGNARREAALSNAHQMSAEKACSFAEIRKRSESNWTIPINRKLRSRLSAYAA